MKTNEKKRPREEILTDIASTEEKLQYTTRFAGLAREARDWEAVNRHVFAMGGCVSKLQTLMNELKGAS